MQSKILKKLHFNIAKGKNKRNFHYYFFHTITFIKNKMSNKSVKQRPKSDKSLYLTENENEALISAIESSNCVVKQL